jgi:hypothetical protein
MLLAPWSKSNPSSAFALGSIPPDQTLPDVKEPGGQPQWTSSLTIRSLQTVTCRRKTGAPNTAYGEWKNEDEFVAFVVQTLNLPDLQHWDTKPQN